MVLNAAEYMTGSYGDEVAQIQGFLRSMGYLSTAPDGIFGPLTKQAVQRFQSDKGLVIDGIVGVNTWRAMFNGPRQQAVAPPAQLPAPVRIVAPTVVSSLFLPGQPSPIILIGIGLLAISGVLLKSPKKARARRNPKRRTKR